MKKNNGVTLIALVITIIVLLILAGVAIAYVVGDNGVISNTMKMEVETAKGEVRDHFLLLLNTELVCASADISGTTIDIGTRYNEPKLINFLKGNQNFSGTDHAEEGVIKCIEEFKNPTSSDDVKDIIAKGGEEDSKTIKNKYRVISSSLSPEGDKYGVGKNISDGNIFTLEAITEEETDEDGNKTGNILSTGKFELKYYDKDGNEEVLETISLYVTNQS